MVWSILNAILLLSVLVPQGHLIYDGKEAYPEFSTTSGASVDTIALLSAPPGEPSRDALIDQGGTGDV
ncbi:MAG: transglutaminase domain-containing protein, partial [Methanoculleus sp.]